MIFCPECGAQNTDQITFCLNCGKSISTSTPISISDVSKVEQSRSNKFSTLLKSHKRPVIAIGSSVGALILVFAGIFVASTGVAQPLIGQRWDKDQLAIETSSAREEGFTSGQADGYESGIEEGYKTGESSGYTNGYTIGKSDGYKDGYDSGNSAGYTSGKADGYTSGKADGYTSGYSEGQTYGYTTGYDAGKTAGYATGQTAGYSSGYYNGCALVFSKVGGISFRINNYTYFRSTICGR